MKYIMVAIDPFPVLLMDEEILYRCFDSMTEPYSEYFVEKYIGIFFMFNEFPQLLSRTKQSADEVSEQIKEIRRTISHGHAYYYDFKNDAKIKYYIILLDKLIRSMSLKWIGFSKDEIDEYPIH